jgi:hypothetical protein
VAQESAVTNAAAAVAVAAAADADAAAAAAAGEEIIQAVPPDH